MRKWQDKILFALILYFAGFASAIYFLTPSSASAETTKAGSFSRSVSYADKELSNLPVSEKISNFRSSLTDSPRSRVQSGEQTQKFKAGVDRVLEYSRDKVSVTADYLKRKIKEKGQNLRQEQ